MALLLYVAIRLGPGMVVFPNQLIYENLKKKEKASIMEKNKKIIISIVLALSLIFSYWYYFVDTLKLTQITGKPQNALASIFVNFIDFDTGLTRYDIHNLSRKNEYWQKRIREVMAIQNPQQRNIENEKLLAEMMDDPSIKKIAKKLMGFSIDAVLAILQATK